MPRATSQVCRNCGVLGHAVRDCPCYVCGLQGHFAKNCPYTPSGGACTSSAVRDFAVTLKGPPPAWLFRAPAGRQCPPIAADALAGASLEGLLSFN